MKKLAFTLVELLVVITIIGVLSMVIAFAIRQTSSNAKTARKEADLKSILTAIESKRAENTTVLLNVTGDNCSACKCISNGHVPTDAVCVARMQTTYRNLGFNKTPTDPWGNPYMIDENEREINWFNLYNNWCYAHDTLYSYQHGGLNVPFHICPESEVGLVH